MPPIAVAMQIFTKFVFDELLYLDSLYINKVKLYTVCTYVKVYT